MLFCLSRNADINKTLIEVVIPLDEQIVTAVEHEGNPLVGGYSGVSVSAHLLCDGLEQEGDIGEVVGCQQEFDAVDFGMVIDALYKELVCLQGTSGEGTPASRGDKSRRCWLAIPWGRS